MNNLETVLSKLKTYYNESTYKTVSCQLKKLFELTKSKTLEETTRKDYKYIIRYFNNINNELTKATNINRYISILKQFDIKPSDEIKNYVNKINADARIARKDNQKNKEINNDLDFNKIKIFYYDLLHKQKKYVKAYSNWTVLYYILSEIPIRLTELVNMQYEKNENNNYIDFEKKQLIILKHKNGNKSRFIPLSDETIDIIKYHKEHTKDIKLFSYDSKSIEQAYRNGIKKYCKVNNIVYKSKCMGIHQARSNHSTMLMKKLDIKLTEEQYNMLIKDCAMTGHNLTCRLRDYIVK
jgi:integrase